VTCKYRSQLDNAYSEIISPSDCSVALLFNVSTLDGRMGPERRIHEPNRLLSRRRRHRRGAKGGESRHGFDRQ
jgi:hypothetical protein